ncbi:hypothetical protein [Pseudomonas phage REC1]|nr:hypothetical protein [Pseudomonas phage REC1]
MSYQQANAVFAINAKPLWSTNTLMFVVGGSQTMVAVKIVSVESIAHTVVHSQP